MPPQITIKKDYILIEPKAGINLREIQQGVARLFYVKGIPEQNRIWVFRKLPQRFQDKQNGAGCTTRGSVGSGRSLY
jgi:hypothetical protein